MSQPNPALTDPMLGAIGPLLSDFVEGLDALGLSRECITNALLGIAIGNAIGEAWTKDRVMVAVDQGYDDISKAALAIDAVNAPGTDLEESPS